MKTSVAKNILRAISYVRRENIWQSLEFLENSQWWTYERIQEYQQKKLVKLITHCSEKVPFYMRWFEDNSCTPLDIKLHNIDLLPVIDKSFLRDNIGQFIALDCEGPIEWAKTSGSTGIPLHFPKSLKSSAFQRAAMYRGHRWHGVEVGAKEARLWGIPVSKISRYKVVLIDYLLNRFRQREPHNSSAVFDDFCTRLKKRGAVYLAGYTSLVRQFAEYLKDTGRRGLEYGFKMVKCTSETIFDSDREIIEAVFGCPLVSEYGAAETGVIAFQCEAGSQHLMSDCCIVEFLDPKDKIGDPDLKEVVVTNLNNFTLPFLRYRIGDLAIPSLENCSCGRELPLVRKIVGRVDDVIKASDGCHWLSSFLEDLLKELAIKHRSIAQFKVLQSEMGKLEFLLVPKENFTPEFKAYLRKKCMEYFDGKMEIDIRLVDNIPREASGKLRYFVSTI